jgi:AGZA family xanthine/uracil permease-like MFS transporter
LIRPHGVVAWPPSLQPTLLKLDLRGALAHLDLVFVFLFMLVFDTVGTLIAVAEQAGLMREGRLPRAERAMLSDAAGTMVGAALGTSTVSSYIESASGVAEGARTGLALATAALFLAALFFSPLVAMVGGGVERGGLFYYPITAPAVIVMGSFMMGQVARIRWDDATEALPAFAALVAIRSRSTSRTAWRPASWPTRR